jgi:hypothetical protein
MRHTMVQGMETEASEEQKQVRFQVCCVFSVAFCWRVLT